MTRRALLPSPTRTYEGDTVNSTDETTNGEQAMRRLHDATDTIQAAWKLVDETSDLHPAEIYNIIGALRQITSQVHQVSVRVAERATGLVGNPALVASDGSDPDTGLRTCMAHLTVAGQNIAAADTYIGLAQSPITWVNLMPEAGENA